MLLAASIVSLPGGRAAYECPVGDPDPDHCDDALLANSEAASVESAYAAHFGVAYDAPGILSPPPGSDVPVLGDIEVVVYHPDLAVSGVELWDWSSGSPSFVGVATPTLEQAEGSGCEVNPSACMHPGFFRFEWHVGGERPYYQIEARVQGSPVGFGQAQYLPDVAPDINDLADAVSDPSVTLEGNIQAPSTVDAWWNFYPLPLYPYNVTVGKPDGSKGLSKKDQHVEGDRLSGDLDADGKKGDMSCAPTSAASSLAWFAQNKPGSSGIMNWTGTNATNGGVMTNKDLVNIIGLLAGTNDGGTIPANLTKAIQTWLDYKLGAGKFQATLVPGLVNLTNVAKEYNRGQDVLLGLYWNGGGAHRVAVNNIVMNPDGSAMVTIMDPWNGTYQTFRVEANGSTTYGGGATVRAMIHVSPKEEAPRPVTPIPTLPYSPGAGTTTAHWPTPSPGQYMVVLTTMTSYGKPGYDYSLVLVTGTPPPVPELPGLALVGVGAIALALLARRRLL